MIRGEGKPAPREVIGWPAGHAEQIVGQLQAAFLEKFQRIRAVDNGQKAVRSSKGRIDMRKLQHGRQVRAQGSIMPTLKRSEAERAIVLEWDVWAPEKAASFGPSADMCFFYHLQRAKPELLDFGYSGDKWRAVRTVLLSADRITY
jgi:hypothetical protein